MCEYAEAIAKGATSQTGKSAVAIATKCDAALSPNNPHGITRERLFACGWRRARCRGLAAEVRAEAQHAPRAKWTEIH